MMNPLEQLSPRERRTVVGGGAALILVVLYFGIWLPLTDKMDALGRSVMQKRQDVAWMRQAAAEVRQLKGTSAASSTASGSRSLLGVINQTARPLLKGAVVKRVEEEQRDSVRVWIEQTAFDDLMRWLDLLERRHGVTISSLVIDRQDQPGRVNVRLIVRGGEA